MPCTDPPDQSCDAITRYRECVCLQDCGNEERILQICRARQLAFYFLSNASFTASRTI